MIPRWRSGARAQAKAVLIAIFSLVLAGCLGVQRTTPDDPVAAGGLTPSQHDRDAGLVGMASSFDLKEYRVIAVERFSLTEMKTEEEDRQLGVAMASFLQSEIVRRLRDTGLFSKVVNLSETELTASPERALRLRGTISRMERGSQATRVMFGIYGAGRARAQMEVHFVDAQSGTVVLVTANRRIGTSVSAGAGEDHLRGLFDAMAEDLARFLTRLAKGEAPRE